MFLIFLALDDNKMVVESDPERLGDQDVGGYFKVRKSRADSDYARSFKFSLTNTLLCFVLLKLRFTGETLRFPNIIQNYQKVFPIAFEHLRRSTSAIYFVLDIVHTILALMIIQNTHKLCASDCIVVSRKFCKKEY